MQTGSNELMRDINTRLILETLIQNVSISRADIAKKLGLTRATVSAITEQLKQQDLILEDGNSASGQGRKAVLYRLHREHGFHLCINLSWDGLTIMCADLLGQHRQVYGYPPAQDPLTILDTVCSAVTDALRQYDGKGSLVRICIAVHGTVYQNRITFCPYSPYENIPFADTLSRRFQVPVLLENEANLCAIGEQACSFPAGSMIFVSVHSGIGIGIMFDGKLFHGFTGKAGEFGHTIIEKDGRPCPCGNRGCLEQYASEQAVLKEYRRRRQSESLGFSDFIADCLAGAPEASDILESFESYMAIAINNLLNTFNPEALILNSRIINQMPWRLDNIRKRITGRTCGHLPLFASGLQEQAALLGGISLCTIDYLGLHALDLSRYAICGDLLSLT